ncbi:TlpA family protein disulfide reductase [Chelativorans salis]|uniref:Redoxin family protein n=1 Tax=Chelativorans salis TaxID=2978478 RepID=A0ABT2LWL4_9HYPH|nr:redoxin domain-containing protein [Chelativorans sp. EGI FJ00035]MCT7378509.1 redoxin family protein [Chelativorans sp. EGI FJ00035]
MSTIRAMKPRTAAILAVAVIGGLAAAGALWKFANSDGSEIGAEGSGSSISTATPQASGTLVFHETPQVVPDLSFVNRDGREMSLADFRGQTVLLNIWATWCVPCREEMPSLDRLQAELGGSDFVVVPLSIDRGGIPAVAAFYQELGLTKVGIYVDESGRVFRKLGAVGIPTTLLIGPEGKELGRLVGPAEWDSPEMVALLRGQLQSAANVD